MWNVSRIITVLVILLVNVFADDICLDVAPDCKAFRSYCNEKMFEHYMKSNCPLTCGFCLPDCHDKNKHQCPLLVKYKYCKVDHLKDYMLQNCKKSCGLCTAPTTAPPPTHKPITLPMTTCGRSSVAQSRIVSGQDALPGAWPWQILITKNGWSNCGGSLIHPRWIVTAAHCVDTDLSILAIRTGEHDTTKLEGTEDEYDIEHVEIHEKYDRRTMDNDIALIKLKRPVIMSRHTSPVCLPKKTVSNGKYCYISGWGKLTAVGNPHHTLQQAKLPVISNSRCHNKNIISTNITVTPRMVCAGYGAQSPTSGCHGDSGGPFVCQTSNGQWELQGVVSWGTMDCDSKKGFTVFARTTEFLAWISKKANII